VKISIITPSFNQGPFIADAIESVLLQKYNNFEHIIVDNCSTDETASILARYPHVKVICEKDRGQSDALNKGFKAATGDIVGWLNADDKYLPGCFDAILKAFAQKPSSDIIYGDYRFVDAKGGLIRVRKELGFDMFMLKYLHVLYIPTTTSFFRRKVFDQGNFIDISYHYAMDYEFFVRLAQRGYKFGHVPKVMADFRWHEGNKSLALKKAQDEQTRALFDHDPFLRSVPVVCRGSVRSFFMLLARVKRTGLKLIRGAY
jgi:glycosyltransferase involved in cell wall biosynthesis